MATKKDKVEIRSDAMRGAMEIVARSFEADKILKRQVQGGKEAKYVKSQEYIARLNEAFGVAWSLEIVQHWLANNQLMMWVRIHYLNPDNPSQLFYKDGIAGHPFSGDAGNAFKSVYSKAFTIAAAKVGIGLHLWGVETDDDEAPVWDQQTTPVSTPVPSYPPPVAAGTLPPVPGGYPPPPPAAGVPQFVNNEAISNPPPPYTVPPTPTPPPIPSGNPSAGVEVPQQVGYTSGLGTPAAAGVAINAAPAIGGDMIKDFQANGIVGASVSLGVDAVQLCYQILGGEINGLTSIEQLTADQANRVLLAVRQMPPQ